MSPLVTVLMPVYNAEEYLAEAIESVLNQTFRDFKLLIINDGSTDKSVEIIESYSDKRIRTIHNQKNIGLIATLNIGLDEIETKYIVRSDADDVCLPKRLETQVSFMEANPNVGVCGTWFDNFDTFGIQVGARYASDDIAIKLKHLYQIHISHGTAILRNAVIKANELRFNPEFSHAEDYDFFDRMGQVSDLANIPEVLYQVRQHDKSVSKTYSTIQRVNSEHVKTRIFLRIGLEVSSRDLDLYRTLQHQSYRQLIDNCEELLLLLNRMFESNIVSKSFPIERLREHLSSSWFNYCNANASRSFAGYKWLKKAVFIETSKLSFAQLLKLKIKEKIRQ